VLSPVVVVGKQAHSALKARLPRLPEPPYVTSAELGGRRRTVVFISHPSSFRGAKTITGLYGTETLTRLRTIAQGASDRLQQQEAN
jgi:hypothetical protein